MAFDSAKRAISGTWGEVWLEGDLVAECVAAQAKLKYIKEQVPRCGQMMVDSKVTAIEATGSLKLTKVYSRMIAQRANDLRDGRDVRYTIMMKLADPDSYGAERVVLRNVSFDDLTLMDFEAKAIKSEECPFTFTDYELLDLIAVQ